MQPDAKARTAGSALREGLSEAVCVIVGMLFVHRELFTGHSQDFHFGNVTEPILLGLAFVDGAVAARLAAFEPAPPELPPGQVKRWRWLTAAIAILYVACGALSQKLCVGTFGNSDELVRWVGLALVTGGLFVRIWAAASLPRLLRHLAVDQPAVVATGAYHWLRFPDRFGQLLVVAGVAFCFNTWLPLLAVPGLLVLLRWQITSLEESRENRLGEPYLQYKKSTRILLPLIY